MTNDTKNNWKTACLILGALLVISIGVSANYANKSYCENEDCDEQYAGVCFDKDSAFYKCNLDIDMCSLQDWEAANVMKEMEKNNLVIYGIPTCGWCNKQIEEFGELENYLYEKGLYIDCHDPSNKEVCADVRSTPTWKKNGEIVKSGYMPLEDIISSFR